jgi:hypothetical protein
MPHGGLIFAGPEKWIIIVKKGKEAATKQSVGKLEDGNFL